jgi:hypothetical protein
MSEYRENRENECRGEELRDVGTMVMTTMHGTNEETVRYARNVTEEFFETVQYYLHQRVSI